MTLWPTDTPTRPVTPTATRRFGVLLTTSGSIGLLAAVVLLVEKIELVKNPDYVPTCSINPILSCGSVMTTSQAEAFGIPNPIIGVAGFAVATTIGAALLAGATFARWFWIAFQAGVTFGVVFVHWLIYQSLYVIGALCPYCMIVWIVMIAIFWHTTVHIVRSGTDIAPSTPTQRVLHTAIHYRGAILTAWYLIITALIAQRFWDYWTGLI